MIAAHFSNRLHYGGKNRPLQIVTVEEAMHLRDLSLRLPARRDDAFKRAVVEKDPGAQGRLDL